MSQAGILNTQSSPPPVNVPIDFVTDDGTAISAANILNVNGETSEDNNTNGIQTFANPDLSNNLEIQLTNRIVGSLTTTDASSQTLYSFNMGATAGTYVFFTRVVAYNVTDSTSAGYASYRCVRTTGAAGTLISAQSGLIAEEGTMSGAAAINDISGNNATLIVQGLIGKTINWYAMTEYTFVGA